MSKKKKAVAEKQPVINQSYELVATARLVPHPRNVNRGDLVAIGGSIAENGFYGAIVAQKSTGYILAGNHRYEAAKTAGIAEVPVTWVDVDDDRALRILLADNRTTRLGHDDQEALAALLQEILENSETLAGTGFDEAALDELLAEVGITECAPEGLTDEDAVPEPLAFPVTELGDLWVLGKHRLLCGDSTDSDAFGLLMDGSVAELSFTSPPYADQREYNGGKDLSTQHLATFMRAAHGGVRYFAVNLGIARKDGAVVRYWDDYIVEAESLGLKLLSWNIWDRLYPASIAQQTAMFPIEHEWVFLFGQTPKELNQTVANKHGGSVVESSTNRQTDGSLKRQKRREIAEGRALGTILVCDIHRGDAPHPAMFPVAFPEAYIEAATQTADVVYEPFGGSGSTLIACEKTARNARLMELDPKYCDVIVRRWQEFTGKEAVLESDGRTFNEIADERQSAAAAA